MSDHSSHALVTHQGKLLLLLRDNRPDISDPNRWSLPGGGNEKNETPEETLLRELEEEICVKVKPKDSQLLFKLPGKEVYLYLVRLNKRAAKLVKLGNEGQKLQFFDVDDLEKIPLTNILAEQLPQYREFLRLLISST